MDVDLWRIINASIRECLEEYDPSHTLECLHGLLEKYGDDGMIHYALGLEYEARFDFERALYHYNRAYELFPLRLWKERALEAIRRVQSKIMERSRIELSETQALEHRNTKQ
ncbi:hypothetical protein J4526_07800 [Desulfurococcaceae archaeon MEX13E-LK6-19]|nr:hypothetical protein J4526_07800 [Desulfurococcaceae archaeon MEX13E-LK6-19]